MWMTEGEGSLKCETENSMLAGRTKLSGRTTDERNSKDDSSPLCRMCKKAVHTISHIYSILLLGCSDLTLTAYKERHDGASSAVYCCLAKKLGFSAHN